MVGLLTSRLKGDGVWRRMTACAAAHASFLSQEFIQFELDQDV
jgi:hypothetical protein